MVQHKKNRFLLQDGAKAHTAKKTLAYLKRRDLTVVQLPPYAPHMNAIEHMWRHLHELVAQKQAETLEELIAAIHLSWSEIPMSVSNAHCQHFNTVVLGEESKKKKK